LRARLNLGQTNNALERLAALQLAISNDRHEWHLTLRGKRSNVTTVPAAQKRGPKPSTAQMPGAGAIRLLALLDRPQRGTALMTMLGVTRQRVHQLTVALSAFGLIRLANPDFPTFVIARKDDPSILLRRDEERMLSAFPEVEATTLSRIMRVFEIPTAKLDGITKSLCRMGLIEKAGMATYGALFRLTPAGAVHWQRSLTAPQADAPPLPFRSDRVQSVLSYLESHGPIRTRDVGLALGVGKATINALMQYLKRKNAVRLVSDAHFAPYELTAEGREILAAMERRAAVYLSDPGLGTLMDRKAG
jgi:DNA-binding IclR family transcriptional regulator